MSGLPTRSNGDVWRSLMKDIPIVFPLSLLVIILLSFFSGAYAISENALSDQPAAIVAAAEQGETDHQWFERGAIWACPLH